MKINFTTGIVCLGFGLAACGALPQNTALPTQEDQPPITSVRPAEVSEANGWKQIVPGYWTKTEEYMGGPLVTTYIDHSQKMAVEHELKIQEAAKQRLIGEGLLPMQMQTEGNGYTNLLRDVLKKLNGGLTRSQAASLNAQFVCTTNPAFSVGPYNNGSRVGVVSYVSGSCTNGGRASAIAKYNGLTSNTFDDNISQTRTYSTTADATRYTLTPAPNSATDCGEARMGSTGSTIKRHWGNPGDCIYYN